MVDNFKNKLKSKISRTFEIPEDITMDLPRLNLLSNYYLAIYNPKGFIEFNDEIIRINSEIGEIVLKGKSLKISSILPEEIIIEGEIKSITIEG